MLQNFRFKTPKLFSLSCLLPLLVGNTMAATPPFPYKQSVRSFQSVGDLPPPAEEGCWHANPHEKLWTRTACTGYVSKLHNGMRNEYYNVGAGMDYSAVTARLTQTATGTFPVVSGVKFATSDGKPGEDKYSLQLNTNISDTTSGGFGRLGNNSPYCSHHNYSACSTWLQFVYLNGVIFIQNWLNINNADACPAGWNNQGAGREFRSCWKNSSGMSVPKIPVSELGKVSLKGIVGNGFNTLMFTDNNGGMTATSQSDDTLEISSTWKQSEFNVFSSNSETVRFNPGSSLTVKLEVEDGTINAPTCKGPAQGGTTAESTNLNLGKCRAFSGSPAGIEFTQSK